MAIELWAGVRNIKAPIIYILGGASSIVPAETQEQLRQAMPRVQIVTMPGLGHYPSDEKPGDFSSMPHDLSRKPIMATTVRNETASPENSMHNDDRQTGRIMSRREALFLLGTAGTAMLAGRSSWSSAAEPALSCIESPSQTEGPYFVDERLNRSDIRADPADGSVREGLPLTLKLVIASVARGQCAPLAGAVVDLWHCDAAGVYSDASDPGFNTIGKTFLRGYQVTDAGGGVRFTTVYPGWYDGRTVHMHFKVRGAAGSKRSYEFTSQLYFDDAVTDRAYARNPYARRGRRTVRNGGDGIFRDGGSRMILPLVESDAGYAANFNVGLRLA